MTAEQPTSQNDRIVLAVCLVVILCSAILHLSQSGDHAAILFGFRIPELCPFRRISGFWCPGCGLIRSFVSTAHGDISGAFRFHPVGPILFVITTLQIPYRVWRITRVNLSSAPKRVILSDAIPNTILIALLMLGFFRIAWGFTHKSLIGSDVVPPSSWLWSLALISSAAAIYYVIQLLQRKKQQLHAAASAMPTAPPAQ